MAFYYLSPFVGTGLGNDPFRPPVDGPMGLIDLRGDSTDQAGWCLLRLDAPATVAGAIELGDSLDGPMTRTVSRGLESKLGLTLDSRMRLREIIVELLLRHATPSGDKTRWNRIQTNSRGRHKITLGGEVVYDAPDIRNLIVTDDFNRADEALEASASWSVSDVGPFDIVTNQLVNDSTSGRQTAWWDDDTFGPNMYTQAECVAFAALHGLIARHNGEDPDTTGTMYQFRNTNVASDWTLEKIVSGSATLLANTGSRANGTHRLEVDGSNLVGRNNGAQVISATDTAITVAGFGGFFGSTFQTGDPSTWDDFEASDLPIVVAIGTLAEADSLV
ncbi:hypothetical protein LCGC14_2997670, partial [marine sediment metagenome]